MKKIFVFSIIISSFFLLSTDVFSQDDVERGKIIFQKAREAYSQHWPSQFVSEVTGRDIDEELETIFADVENQSARQRAINQAKVWFFFKRDCDPSQKILIKNVHEIHTTRFENYITMFESFAQFLSPYANYQTFTRSYDWTFYFQSRTDIQVRMHHKDKSENTYFLIYFNPQTYLITKGVQFVDGERNGELSILYKDYRGHKVPVTLYGRADVYERGEQVTKNFVFRLQENPHLNRNLSCNDFLDEEQLLRRAP
jgi:hypothetical protein